MATVAFPCRGGWEWRLRFALAWVTSRMRCLRLAHEKIGAKRGPVYCSSCAGSRSLALARWMSRSRQSAASSASARCLASPGADARGLHLADSSAPRFAERGFMERQPGSLGLDVGRTDHLGPFHGFSSDKPAKVGGREREHVATQVGKPRLDFGIGEARVDLPVELVDEFGPRVFGCAKSQPGARLVSRHKITDGRNFRKRIRTPCSRHRQGAEFAGPD